MVWPKEEKNSVLYYVVRMLVYSESFFGRREDWTGTVLYDAPLCRFKEIGTKNVLERDP